MGEIQETVLDRLSLMAERMARMEAMLSSLCGNGQPGRIGRNEEEIKNLWSIVGKLSERTSYGKGYLAAIGAAAAAIGAAAAALLGWIRH